MTWTDVMALVGAVGGTVGAVGGVIGAIGGFRGHRARNLVAGASRAAANALEQAAQANTRATELAESSLRLARDRRHDKLAPKPRPECIEVQRVPHARIPDRVSYRWSIILTRSYRVQVDAIVGPSATHRVDLGPLLHANRTYGFEFEQSPSDQARPVTQELRFRFWPPADEDHDGDWSCPCARQPPAYGDRGHWEWKIPVRYEERGPWVAYGPPPFGPAR